MKSGTSRSWLVAPLALSLLACGRPTAQFAIPATFDRSVEAAQADDLPRIAPEPAEGEAFPGEAIVKFRDGEVPVDIPGAEHIEAVGAVPGAHVYRLTGGRYTTAAVSSLEADPRVEYVEPRYVYRTLEYYPPGEDFGDMYGLKKIQAPAAWDKARGRKDVVVAVVDTGVDYRHPDLAGVVVKGPDLSNRDADSMDDHGHGTHVAGTIGAIANGRGIVGVAFGVKILGVKVLSAKGSGSQDTIAKGIMASVENGAKVVNLSLGGPDSRTLREAIAKATKAGVLCVAAAGNDGDTNPDYPGANPDALGVGSSDSGDRRSSFSNYGTTVDIAAPGSSIYSLGLNGGYRKLSGTSMATPHVAGAAALLLSKRPGLTVAQLRRLLETTGDPVSGFTKTPSVKRLNLASALTALDTLGDEPDPGEDPANGGPAIRDVKVVRTTKDSATIRWQTDAPAQSTLEFGETASYGGVAEAQAAYKTEHEATLKDLKRFKTYHYRITATAESGLQSATEDRTFRTKLWWIFSVEGGPGQED